MAPDSLRSAIVGHAAANAQRMLHYRALAAGPAQQGGQLPGSFDGGSAPPGSGGESPMSRRQPSSREEEQAAVELAVERRLLEETAAAREQCKREAILARLQAELPGFVVRAWAAR